MSISRRIINLARSELNELLDRASKIGDDEDDENEAVEDERGEERAGRTAGRRRAGGEPVDLSSLSDEELSAEIERRRRQREAEARGHKPPDAADGARRSSPGAGGSRSSPHAGGPGSSRRAAAPPPDRGQIARAYASLEVPPGSDFETVRRAYRTLMRKYHPDRHTQSADKQRTATELAQKLTESYKLLERHLRR